MSLEKSFATDDHADLVREAGGRASTFFERPHGKGGFTKSASEVITRRDLQDHMPPDTHFGVHLISLGMEEDLGPNRNGDSWSRESLRKHHKSFEKFGCLFREHKNRNPHTQGVGQVKLARVNEKMKRGELVVWVDKEKAPDMYKKARDGEELSFSMSCRLPHDECSVCRKKSRTTASYCGHLRDHMLQYVKGHEKYAYARNEEDVKFFDISEVKRRADRIATYLGYFGDRDLMHKAASADDVVITGAQWALHQFGQSRTVPFDAWEELTLEKMAAAEEFVRRADPETLEALARIAPQTLTREQIETLAQPDFRNAGGELAKKGMVINFPSFASMVTGRDVGDLECDAGYNDVVESRLPTLVSDMLRGGGCCCGEEAAEAVSPDECGMTFSSGGDSIDRLMREAGNDLGMSNDNATQRALTVTIVKRASVRRPSSGSSLDPYFNSLAEAYGHYLVKAAHQIKDLPGVSPNTLYRGLVASLLIHMR